MYKQLKIYVHNRWLCTKIYVQTCIGVQSERWNPTCRNWNQFRNAKSGSPSCRNVQVWKYCNCL